MRNAGGKEQKAEGLKIGAPRVVGLISTATVKQGDQYRDVRCHFDAQKAGLRLESR